MKKEKIDGSSRNFSQQQSILNLVFIQNRGYTINKYNILYFRCQIKCVLLK